MNVNFTKEQEEAIHLTGCNIIVSASAGSGKTAVLIERIIHLLEIDDSLRIKELAVMTFTKAAAAEMKERLSKRINEKILEGKDVNRWTKLLYELVGANITTIDSFCNSIVQNNFYRIRQDQIGLDVNYRIIDEIDLKILKNEILDEQIRALHSSKNTLLTDYFEEKLLSNRLKEIILKISDFCDSEPYGDELLGLISDMYLGKIEPDNEALASYAVLYHKDKNLQKYYEEIKNSFIADARLDDLKDVALALINEVRSFRYVLLKKKLQAGQLSFSDLEHFALDILINRENKVSKPSNIAKSYQRYFKHILVDEYQDSNYVQEELINSISNGKNLFLVGDLKQSIYGFRQARCELFSKRLSSYDSNNGGRAIYLSKNFRSDSRILDFTNKLCQTIMNGESYSIHYNEKQMLVSGKNISENTEPMVEAMFVLEGYSYEKNENISRHERAADAICYRIEKLRNIGYNYSDIAILLRSMSGKLYDYIRAFERHNIPYDIKNNTGFLDDTSVRTLIDYLRVIDNSRQDMPLAGVMLSSIGRFTASELIRISLSSDKSFYESVLFYNEAQKSKYYEAELNKKTQDFLKEIADLRAYAAYLPLYDLVRLVLKRSGLYLYVTALKNSEKRQEALRQLLLLAMQFSNSGATVSGFLHYLEKIEENDLKIERKGKVKEASDSIKLMTVHGSKGLEFKIVFFADLAGSFNIKESTPAINSRMGLGLPIIDIKKRVKHTSLLLNLINEANKRQELEEEIRLMYVALTRAKERLYLTFDGALSANISKAIYAHNKEVLKAPTTQTYSSLCDYILPIICKSTPLFLVNMLALSDPDFFEKNKKKGYELELDPEGFDKAHDYSMVADGVRLNLLAPIANDILVDDSITMNEADNIDIINDSTQKAIEKNLAFSYENIDANKPLKLSVTEYKRLKNMLKGEFKDDKDDTIPNQIDFTIKDSVNTTIGTLYHKILELWDFKRKYNSIDDVEILLNQIAAQGIIDFDLMQRIDKKKLLDFAHSTLYNRMEKAYKNGLLYREESFLYEIKANELFDNAGNQPILIEGIVDAYFIEDKKLVIIDYKSDRSNDMSYYIDNYRASLELYALALEKAYNMPVAELLIYSIGIGELVL